MVAHLPRPRLPQRAWSALRSSMKRRASRVGLALAAALLVPISLALVSFAVPLHLWRTGELPASPLPIVEGGPMVDIPKRIWIDTDAACGHDRTADPDDCLALLLFARTRGIEIAGISTVHGNASLDITHATTRDLVERLDREGAVMGPLYRGSAHALGAAAGPDSAPAHAALRAALEKNPLTVVALGPLTNIAAALEGRPDLQRNVARLVAVMGRRPGHLFHPGEARGRGMLFGHGPVFRDFNFDKDVNAAVLVLSMRLPLTLVPYAAARQVEVSASDLQRLETRQGAAAWVAGRARGWLSFWEEGVGRSGFYPFDLLAAAYVVQPNLLSCADVHAWVGRDLKLWGRLYGPESLLVGTGGEDQPGAKTAGSALYCPQVDRQTLQWLVSRLVGLPDEKRGPVALLEAHDGRKPGPGWRSWGGG